jgi:hypothetical protein
MFLRSHNFSLRGSMKKYLALVMVSLLVIGIHANALANTVYAAPKACPVIPRANVNVRIHQLMIKPQDAQGWMDDLANKVDLLAKKNNFVLGTWKKERHFNINTVHIKDQKGNPIDAYMLDGTVVYDDFDDVNLADNFLQLLATNKFDASLQETQGMSSWCLKKQK